MKKIIVTGILFLFAAVHGAEPEGRIITYVADDNWKSIEWKPYEMVPGSALDFSAFIPPQRQLSIEGENFVADDGKRVFNGIGMSHGLAFMTKDQAEKMANLIAASGFNAVRFHLYPDFLGKRDPGSNWADGRGSAELDPEKLDQFHYFLACLKKRGIYYTMPMASWGHLKPGVIKDVEEYKNDKIRTELSALYAVSEDAMKYICDFSRNLLCSVNPYTGMRMLDDPALLSIESGNENSPFAVMSHRPKLLVVYRRLCTEYLKSQGKNPTAEELEQYLPRYILEMHEKGFARFREFLRGLGLKQPITDMDFRGNMIYSLPRSASGCDYADIHAYWDLYKRLEGSKTQYRVRGINPFEKKWEATSQAAAGRIIGKPFIVGEYNSNYPSPHWAQMPPAEAAIALSQNWSGIFLYSLTPFPGPAFKEENIPAEHVQSFNPMILFSARIAGKMMLRQEIKPFETTIPLLLTPEFLYSKLDIKGGPTSPSSYRELMLGCRIGTVVWEDGKSVPDAYAAMAVPGGMKAPDKLKNIKLVTADKGLAKALGAIVPGLESGIIKGVNGQIETDTVKKSQKIMTPWSECLMFSDETGKELAGRTLTISGNSGTSTCFVGSLDGAELLKSRRMIAFYITDLRNSGCRLEYREDGIIVRELGKGPYLLRQGEVEFTVRSENRELPQVWALRYDGSRKAELSVSATPDGFSFKARAVNASDAYFAYEIVRK